MKLDAIIRVSKVGYRDTNLQSDREQLAMIRAYCDQRGIELGVVHVEKDVSGKTTNRKALNAARKRALDGDTDGVIAAYLSRFSRNTKEGLELVADLLDAGREFVALDLAGMDLRSTAGEQMLTMMLGQARAEWRTRQESFNHYRTTAVKRGVHLSERFGYRKGDGGKLVADPFEAPYVRVVFAKRATGVSWTKIADWLNDENVKPHTFSDRKDGQPTRRKTGEQWTAQRVKALVESRTYLGEAWSGDIVTADAHEALVDHKTFMACEALRDLRPRRGAAEYVLSGIATCECGGRMKGSTTHKRGVAYRYYACAGCKGRKANATKLEAMVAELFAETARGLRVYAVERDGNLDAALAHVADMEALELQAGSDLDLMRASRPAYLAAVAEAAERVRVAKNRASAERSRLTGVSVTDDDLAGWDDLPVDVRRRFLAEAFETIVVNADRTDAAPIGRGELADAESIIGRFLAFA
jgi:DNA invertase Pin-like site-specific DNA recombinase